MTDIFLSYASEDLERIKPLVAALEESGWSVWWDRELVAGPSFDDKIEEALSAARCVVVVWSRHSVQSRWVRAEASEGLERDVLVPVLIDDDVRPPLPFRMSQTARLVGWPQLADGLGKVTQGIRELLGSSVDASAQSASVTTMPRSIAVLAFVNMSNDPEQDYFAEGIAEDILNGLCKIPGLMVTARTSSFSFKGRNVDVREIGRLLNVSHVLEGSVRKAGKRIRLTAQLIKTDLGIHIWSEQYDRDLDDVFAVQDEITASVLSALKVHLTAYQLEPRRPVSTDAYEAFLKGSAHLSHGDMESARESFERASALDRDYADPYAALALAEVLIGGLDTAVPLTRTLPQAFHYADEALARDPGHPRAKSVKALSFFVEDREYQKWIDARWALFESEVSANTLEGLVFLLPLGFPEALLSCTERWAELDPFNPMAHLERSIALLTLGRHEETRACLNTAQALGLDVPFLQAVLAAFEEDVDRIQAQLDKGRENWLLYRESYDFVLACVPWLQGDKDRVAAILSSSRESAEQKSPLVQAFEAMLLGDVDRVLSFLEAALALKYQTAFTSAQGMEGMRRLFPEIFEDPRYQQMLAKFRLDRESLAQIRLPALPF